jgi:integrase
LNHKTPENASIVKNKLSTFSANSTNSRQLLTANDGDNNGATTLSNLVLWFTKAELCSYVDARITGLADTSRDWIVRAAKELWLNTRGEISQDTMKHLRGTILARYSSVWSHGKTLSFAKAFLKYLTKIRLDTSYRAFELFLEMPKQIKQRMAVTSRIITHTDRDNVLTHIKRAELEGRISSYRALEYTAFILFSAYTGQRSMATTAQLTVGQFRDALANDKPVIHVKASQDKIRYEHYVPLHPAVIDAITSLLHGRVKNEKMFSYNSINQWFKREKIPLTRVTAHFTLGDTRKFAEQWGDVIGWDASNRAYILTHGVSGIDWKHYKHPLPENVYDVYMRYWRGVELSMA